MTFWCGSGSGSADPCFWLMDPDPDLDPDPAIFIIDLQDGNKNLYKKFFLLLSEGTFTWFFKHKMSKRSHKTKGIKVFLTIFACWLKNDWRIREGQKRVDSLDPDPFGSGTLDTSKKNSSAEEFLQSSGCWKCAAEHCNTNALSSATWAITSSGFFRVIDIGRQGKSCLCMTCMGHSWEKGFQERGVTTSPSPCAFVH